MTVISETGLTLSPYPGLRPFRRDEADVFFGREEQVDQLLGKLETCRFLAVVGVSGCGKSSLVRAGMLSALEGGFMASAGPRWHVVEMRPGGHPLANLAQALLRGEVLDETWRDRPDAEAFICAVLRRGPLGLVELIRESLQPRQNNLLLLVDQFEEIFRFHTHGDAGEATAFVDLLLQSARQSEVPIYVVLTMRSDFLGDCSIFTDLPEGINDGQFLIPRLTREQCRAAVVGPAAAFGAAVQPELVNRVLNDIGSNPDQLPLMQHALMRIWNGAAGNVESGELRVESEEADGVTLTLADYEAVGGLKNALSNHADELFAGLSADDQRIAEVLFRCLSERGADGRDIRRPVPLRAVAEVAQVSEEAIVRIVDVFREPTCSFLTPPAGTPLQPDTVLDISHESLIRQWHRMAGWVQAEADSAAIYRRLSETALLWKKQHAALWDTPDLENALAWRERERPNAIWARRYGGSFSESMAFLDASVTAHDRRERHETERQERERELLQNMARAEKQRADDAEERRKEQAKANTLLKRRAITAVGAGVVALLLAVAAFVLYVQARGEQRRADQARQDAETARQRADDLAEKEADARKRSEQAELAALQASHSAFRNLGRAQLAQLRSLWNSNEPGRQEKALKLLKESANLRQTSAAAGRQSDDQRKEIRQYWRQLTPQLREQAVRWLSLTSLQQIRGIPIAYSGSSGSAHVSRIALSRDGKRLALYKPGERNAGEFQILDLATGNVLTSAKTSPAGRQYPLGIGFSANGGMVLAAVGGTVNPAVEYRSATDLSLRKTIKLSTEGWTRNLLYYTGDREEYWFDGNGRHLVYSGYGGVAVWDTDTGRRLYSGDNQERAVKTERIDDTFAVVEHRNAVVFVSLKNGRRLRRFPFAEANSTITGATLSPDGNWLAVELNYRYTGSGQYELPLLIANAASGEVVSRVNLSLGNYAYSSTRTLEVAFHPTRPVLSVLDNQYVSLISVPQGGVLYRTLAAATPDAGRRRFAADQIAFNRTGDLLLTALRDVNYYPSNSGDRPLVMLQLWDPSVATASLQTLALEGAVQDFTFAGEDALAVAGGDEKRTGVQLRPLKGIQSWSTTSESPTGGFEPSGKHYVHVLPNQVDVLDAQTGKRIKSIDRRWPGYSSPLPVSKSHRWIVGVDREGKEPKLRLFDAGSLKWSHELLPAGGSVQMVMFDDDGEYVAFNGSASDGRAASGRTRTIVRQTPFGPREVESSGSGRSRSVVVRTRDGARIFESTKSFNDWRFAKSGYLLTRDYENNEYVLRAWDLKVGRSTSEFHAPSSGYSLTLRSHFWLDADEKTAAFLGRDSGSARVFVWPFAAGETAQALPMVLTSYYNNSVDVLRDYILLAGRLPARNVTRTVKGKKTTKRYPSRYAAQIWDARTRRLVKNFGHPRNSIAYLASEAHGKIMIFWASRSSNATTGLWDIKTGEKISEIRGYPRGLSPDGRFAVFSKGEVLDLSNNKLRPSPNGSLITSYHFSKDSAYLVTIARTDEDSTIGILNLRDPRAKWKLDRSLKSVYQADLSPDNRLLMVYSYKTPHLVHLWDLKTGAKLGTKGIRRGNFRSDVDTVSRLTLFQFSPDSRHYAVVSHDQLRLGNMDGKHVHTELPRAGHRLAVNAVAVSPDRKFVASGSADETVCFWNAKDGRYLGMLEDGGNSSIRGVVFSPRGNLIATRKENGEIVVWKWSPPADKDGQIAANYLWSNARSDGRPLAFNPDGTLLAAGDADGGIRLFDARTGMIVHWLQPRGPVGGVQGLAFTPDGGQLAASRGHVIGLWDVKSGALARAWDAGQGQIFDLGLPSDGRYLISTGRDVRIWDPRTGLLQLTLDKNTSAVRHVAVSDSGERLAFAVDDRSIVVTNVTGLMKSVEQLGLKMSADASEATAVGAAWKQPLWTPATAKHIALENTLARYLPKAFQAERDQDWKQAVAYLTKLIDIDPANAGYRKRRYSASLELKNWKLAAEDASRLLDAMPHDEYRTSQRSVWLRDLLRHKPELFAALEAARPRDPLLPIVRGRDLTVRSQWKQAQQAYGKLIRRALPHENWYEYAGLCLIAGDRKAYREHLAWMSRQEGQPKGDFNEYVYTRAAGIGDSGVPAAKYLGWGEACISQNRRRGWYLHAVAIASYRAGRIDDAKSLLRESRQTGWMPPLNDLTLGLVEYKSGHFESAKALLKKVRDWRKSVEDGKTEGYVNVLEPDWIEVHVLLPELEALIAQGPPPERKPVEAVKPKRP
jgi:WD40 repeat protein